MKTLSNTTSLQDSQYLQAIDSQGVSIMTKTRVSFGLNTDRNLNILKTLN